MRIGLFDSGLGGLTVLKTLMRKYPNNEYIYYGDTKNIPYGDKTIDELKILSSNIIEFLLNKKVDLIVIACGTVSSNLSDYLKNKYDIEIIDIITPTLEYLNNSNYNNITVLATKRTIDSKIFSKSVNKDIKEIACPMFVPLIENNKLDDLDKYLNEYLKDIKNSDLIVLGCTHYPIIKDRFKNYLGNKKILDMAECISIKEKNTKNKVDLYFSKLDSNVIKNIDLILKNIKYTIN